jgi:hypothetical protein
MYRILSGCIAILLLAGVFGCSEKKVPDASAVKSRNVLTALRGLASSYEKRDQKGFLSGVANDFSDRTAFEKRLADVFAKYDSIKFNIQFTKMDILIDLQGKSRTEFTWDAEWHGSDGSTMKDGGRAVLVFEPAHSALVSIEGRNPFLAQPGEAPGKK